MSSFGSRYAGDPDAIRSMVEHAYRRSLGKSLDQQFEALADVGEFARLYPGLEPIAPNPYVAPLDRPWSPGGIPLGRLG